MRREPYDAIVVGGGHNALTCAAYLARAGLSVVVLERRHLVGGAAVTEEVYPGFRFSVCAYVVSLLRPEVISELELPLHGLEILPLEGTLTPLPDGDALMRGSDPQDARREIARFSPQDADAYGPFGTLMHRLSHAVRPLLSIAPPDVGSLAPGNLRRLSEVGRLLTHAPDLLADLAKLMTMSSADFVEQWFESEPLKGTLSASGIIGTFLGPRSPGSAYVMLHHYMGELDGELRAWGLPRGGMGGVSAALARSASAAGAEIRTSAPVAEIKVRRGRVCGVVLEDGDEVEGRRVVSGVDPKRTFERLLPPEAVDPQLRLELSRYRCRGSSAKVNLALDGLPSFRCLRRLRQRDGRPDEHHLQGAISISPSVDYLERAYDEAKHGRFSSRPYLDIVIPSLRDPSVAPPGQHVMSIFVQYAPYALRQGDWNAARDELGDAVIDTLAEHAPDLRERILHRQVVTPKDLEETFGLTEGNIFHGELSLEQLFFLRPTAASAGYRMDLSGLYLCGSGTHPGGGVMGAPGRLAARALLSDARRARR